MIIIIICSIFIFFWNRSFSHASSMFHSHIQLLEHYSTGSWDIKILIWSMIVSDKYFATFDEFLIHITNIWGSTFVAYNIYLFQLYISPPHVGNINIYPKFQLISIYVHYCGGTIWINLPKMENIWLLTKSQWENS